MRSLGAAGIHDRDKYLYCGFVVAHPSKSLQVAHYSNLLTG